LLKRYDWPGNVRELRNVIERAMLLGAGDVIAVADLTLDQPNAGPPAAPLPSTPLLGPDGAGLQEVERRLVMEAMQRAQGNQTHAARLLKISRDQLRYRLEKFGLMNLSARHRA